MARSVLLLCIGVAMVNVSPSMTLNCIAYGFGSGAGAYGAELVEDTAGSALNSANAAGVAGSSATSAIASVVRSDYNKQLAAKSINYVVEGLGDKENLVLTLIC